MRFSLACICAALTGCGLLLGSPDVKGDAPDAGDTPPADADVGDADSCVPGPSGLEICGDEVDNDCDGRVDPPGKCACDAYVVMGATGSGDAPDSPIGTIGGGIALVDDSGSRGVVCVAGNVPGDSGEAVFNEEVVVLDGVSVLGNFEVTPEGWAYNANIWPTIRGSVEFDKDVDNRTYLQGFAIHGSGVVRYAVGYRGAAGVLRGNRVRGPATPNSLGVWVASADSAVTDLPEISRNDYIKGGSGAGVETSYGIFVNGSGVTIRDNLEILGGLEESEFRSIGIVIENSESFEIVENREIAGGPAPDSFGIRIFNATGNIEDNVRVTGAATPVGALIDARSRGIEVSCLEPHEVNIRGNISIVGAGADSAMVDQAFGIHVGGCRITISGNAAIAGRTAGSMGDATGIHCGNVFDLDTARCHIDGNEMIAGTKGPASGGLATGVSIGDDARGVVSGNPSIRGCELAGTRCLGVRILSTVKSALIERNRIESHGSGTRGTGVLVRSDLAEVQNNLVLVRPGTEATGIALDLDSSDVLVGPVIQFNTVVGSVPESTTHALSLISVSGGSDSGVGTIVNNNFVCEGRGVAVQPLSGLPHILAYNNLGCLTVYTGLDLGNLGTVSPDFIGNFTAVPTFVDRSARDYHLTPAGNDELIDGATTLYLEPPDDDYDGEGRPEGDGYDIGFDEVVSSL